MMRAVVVSVLAAVALASPALAGTPDFSGMQVRAFIPPKPTPAFTFPDLSGKPVKLDDIRGKVTMLVFWATW